MEDTNAKLMARIFTPASIAVIGASQKLGSIGHMVVQNLVDSMYHGKLFPINPTADAICGIKAYKSIADVPVDTIDLAVVSEERVWVGCGKRRKNFFPFFRFSVFPVFHFSRVVVLTRCFFFSNFFFPFSRTHDSTLCQKNLWCSAQRRLL
jgi:hypothetical protein